MGVFLVHLKSINVDILVGRMNGKLSSLIFLFLSHPFCNLFHFMLGMVHKIKNYIELDTVSLTLNQIKSAVSADFVVICGGKENKFLLNVLSNPIYTPQTKRQNR